jgi:hypothetical protein
VIPRLRIRNVNPLVFSFLLFAVLALVFATHGEAGSPEKPKAKKDYALIVGTVWGPGDRPVYGVKIKIRRAQDNKAKWEVYSDHRGEFAQRLPTGKADYIVSADLKDFKPSDGKPLHPGPDVPVHIDNAERVDIGLHLIP